MPKLIKDGAIVDDSWQEADAEGSALESSQVVTLEQWLQLQDKSGRAVQLEPGEAPAPLFDHLQEIPLVVVNFPLFMDGRGFSYGRELRERGYTGELRASGNFIRDQLTYLQRCGFNAFQMTEGSQLQEALNSLNEFSQSYQAAADQPLPLFRRRV
jgi:uncharacterized protein (DUF934 family)